MSETICRLRMLDVPYLLDRPFDYFLPDGTDPEDAVPGRLCAVPFGAGNHVSFGVIWEVAAGECRDGMKPVLFLCSPAFTLSPSQRRMAQFLHDHTLCSIGEAVRSLFPAAALGTVEERYYDAGGTHAVCDYLREHPGCTANELCDAFGAAVPRLLSRLQKDGAVRREDVIPEGAAPRKVRFASLAKTREEILPLLAEGCKILRSEGQKRLLSTLLDVPEWEDRALIERADATRAQLKALLEKGYVSLREEEVSRSPLDVRCPVRDTSPILLSRAQSEAYETLASLEQEDAPRAALLYGVTGSGKTKVIMRLLDDVLAKGKQAIVMVPEIALTPQTVSGFAARYGERVAVIHSSLSLGERFDAYRRCQRGDVDLVIGTRSAVFAPLPKLGLIVMDEEHEHTYKSDQSPRYHARDAAAFRCGECNAMLLLASATPSVESFYKAKTGRYTLVPLRERYGGATLPPVLIVDMREELRAGNTSPISDKMLEALRETKDGGNQAILFCNRRGYHSALHCKECGEPLVCPNCSVSLTHHTSAMGGYLLCHTCGYKIRPPRTCPNCGSDKLDFRGFGTQKAEGEILSLLPSARVMRMDADTTVGKAAYDRLLDKFRAREADVLLGTQMVAKGHDFPGVTLSGVLLADSSLHMNDFRAAERTFSLLTQVIGRAGRSKKPGRAVIQTYCPEHEVITLAATQDYDRFYEREIKLRRELCFPPFCDIAQLMLSSPEEVPLMTAATAASEWLSREAALIPEEKLVIYGPLEPQIYKSGGKFRLKFVIKCRLSSRVRAFLARFLTEFPKTAGRSVTLSADCNPIGE